MVDSLGDLFDTVDRQLGNVKRMVQLDPLVVGNQGENSRPSLTLGITLNGCTITSIAPGGPAFLSRQLDEGDRVVSADGQPVLASDRTVEAVLNSDGIDGSVCNLKVLKGGRSSSGHEGQIVEVQLRRVREDVLLEVTRAFDLLADISAHAAHNVDDEIKGLAEELSRQVLRVMLDRHDRDVMVSRQHSGEVLECLRSIGVVGESVSQVMALHKTNEELEGQIAKHVKLGDERKRLIKALEHQLDFAQQQNADLTHRLGKEQAAKNATGNSNQQLQSSTSATEVAALKNKLIDMEAQVLEAKRRIEVEKMETSRRAEDVNKLLRTNAEVMKMIEAEKLECTKRGEDVKSLIREVEAAHTRADEAEARYREAMEEADGQIRAAIQAARDSVAHEIEAVRKAAEQDLRALKGTSDMDLRTARENALHEVRTVMERTSKEKETFDSIIKMLNTEVDTLQNALKVERNAHHVELQEAQAQFNSEISRLKRREEDGFEIIAQEKKRGNELSAQCAWLEELVASKTRQLVDVSGTSGNITFPDNKARAQMEAEVQQVREALAIRENQIRRLEQELSMAGDPCMRDHQTAEIERAKLEVSEARREITSLERELYRGENDSKPLVSDTRIHWGPGFAPADSSSYRQPFARGSEARSMDPGYRPSALKGSQGGLGLSGHQSHQQENMTPLEALQMLRAMQGSRGDPRSPAFRV